MSSRTGLLDAPVSVHTSVFVHSTYGAVTTLFNVATSPSRQACHAVDGAGLLQLGVLVTALASLVDFGKQAAL